MINLFLVFGFFFINAGIIQTTPTTSQNKLKIALVTLSTPNRHSFSQFTLQSFKSYAKRWNYDLFTHTEKLDQTRPAAWSKIKAVENLLVTKNYDWVVWLDDDLFITNPAIQLDKIIQEHSHKAHLIITGTPPANINSGIFAIKPSEWSHAFLKDVWEIGYHRYNTDSGCLWEQDAMTELMAKNNYATKISFVPNRTMQTRSELNWKDCPDRDNWRPGDFSLHLAGIHNEARAFLFEELAKNPQVLPALPINFDLVFTIDPDLDPQQTALYSFSYLNKSKHRIALLSFSELSQGYPAVRGVFAQHSLFSHYRYAQRWGHDLYIDYTNNQKRHQSWHSINMINNILANKNYDWILWLDENTIITNPDISLDQLIDKYSKNHHLILSRRQEKQTTSNTIEASVLLVKRSDWSKRFFKHVWNTGEHKKELANGPEETLNYLLGLNLIDDYVSVLPARHLQSFITLLEPGDTKDYGQWQPGDFIANLPGSEEPERLWKIIIYPQLAQNCHSYPKFPAEFSYLTIKQ